MAVREKANAANLSKLAKCSSVTGTSLLLLFLARCWFLFKSFMVQEGTSLHRDEGKDKGGPVESAVVRDFSHNVAFFYLIGYVLLT